MLGPRADDREQAACVSFLPGSGHHLRSARHPGGWPSGPILLLAYIGWHIDWRRPMRRPASQACAVATPLDAAGSAVIRATTRSVVREPRIPRRRGRGNMGRALLGLSGRCSKPCSAGSHGRPSDLSGRSSCSFCACHRRLANHFAVMGDKPSETSQPARPARLARLARPAAAGLAHTSRWLFIYILWSETNGRRRCCIRG